MFCPKCGSQVTEDQKFCPECGNMLSTPVEPNDNPSARAEFNQQNQFASVRPAVSDKDWLVTLLLCIFVGGLGIHRFYVGKTGTGILWLLTGGCLGIGSIIDLIMIAVGSFKDGNDLPVIRNK